MESGDEVKKGEQPRRVLVVEDSPSLRYMMKTILEMAGYSVTEAADGEAALLAAERDRPAVALIDLSLPLLDGFEVARQIRAFPWGATVLLIAATGHDEEDVRTHARESGFDYFEVKPIQIDRLLLLVNKPRMAPGARG